MSKQEPLHSAFDFSTAPEPASLFHGNAELHLGSNNYAGTGEVLLRFLPSPRIIINANFRISQQAASLFVLGNSDNPSFFLSSQKIEGLTSKRTLTTEGVNLDWNTLVEPIGIGDMQAKTSISVISHLFNFPDFRGGQHQDTSAPLGRALLILESEEWKVSIQSLEDSATHQAWNRIDQEGGCFLTHITKLERKDGSSFSGDDALEQRVILSNFLSFVKGSRLWTVCDVGFDASGAKTWETSASPRVDIPAYSWFKKFKGHHVESLFPLFVKRWQQSPEWKNCLAHAIYWYTQANSNGRYLGIDSAIILAQTALERLAHHYLVIDRKMISPEGFKLLWASDQLRMLFSSINIPIEITKTTPDIQKIARKYNWIDAPHALTIIRNSLVHPEKKQGVDDCYFDAWKLSLWYLELSILALCGYTGNYQDRLTGRIIHAPWTRP
jgi:hypothetical protein